MAKKQSLELDVTIKDFRTLRDLAAGIQSLASRLKQAAEELEAGAQELTAAITDEEPPQEP